MSAVEEISKAITALREARDLLERAKAHRVVVRVRAALKSADGARRHAELREDRERMRDAGRRQPSTEPGRCRGSTEQPVGETRARAR